MKFLQSYSVTSKQQPGGSSLGLWLSVDSGVRMSSSCCLTFVLKYKQS